MIYIDLENHPPEDDWINRAEQVTQQLIAAGDHTARMKIIDDNKGLWKELKSHLATIRNRKCWYTESINDGAHCHVDHFRPKTNALDESGADKGGYWWLAFEWMNYRYAGPAPNIRKRDYFPVLQGKANTYGDNIDIEDILLLDPINIDDPDTIAYSPDGSVLPKATNKVSRTYRRADYSIIRYNLNSEGLKEGRREKYRDANKLIRTTQNLLAQQSVNEDISRLNQIRANMRELRNLAHPNSKYSATAKFLLDSCGFDWAKRVAMAG